MTYRYQGDDGQPLTTCPSCMADLTENGEYGAIDLELSVNGQTVTAATYLSEEGVLLDTDDGAVASGFHSCTKCGSCDEDLSPYERTTPLDLSDRADVIVTRLNQLCDLDHVFARTLGQVLVPVNERLAEKLKRPASLVRVIDLLNAIVGGDESAEGLIQEFRNGDGELTGFRCKPEVGR